MVGRWVVTRRAILAADIVVVERGVLKVVGIGVTAFAFTLVMIGGRAVAYRAVLIADIIVAE